MISRKTIIFGFIVLSLAGLIIYSQIVPEKKTVYKEDFKNCNSEGEFLRCKDGALYLETTNSAQTGKGFWNKNVSLSPGKISWNWNGQDLDKFSLWLKVTFSDHKSIYYVAAGSMNPQSEGEYYRDQENRRRFSPSIIISGIPRSTVERNLVEDYEKYCGSAENIKIEKLSAGFGDNSTQHQNILSISDLKIYG
ncbi:hypothetical protein [Methanosarcina barkeri]|uniref:Uncharacterized protein n=1 Tax=Methanosarcina barkeri 227 TaxID=1434106 RepID=A0A0E3R1Y8_METBA|nr:hypothetical protein [Methanosarcina barkeri]AKB58233.1 hypothetical protein MSBR2_1717 [Methanosarcina barkeri 227]